MGFWERHEERQADRSLRMMAPLLKQASDSRWGDFIDSIEFEKRRFFNAKWRIGGWDPGDAPRRPRSTAEVADILEIDSEDVRVRDWDLIDSFRERRRIDHWQKDFVTVPIDVAQTWWDAHYGRQYNQDGSLKPKEQWDTGPPVPPIPDESHSIEDENELRRHLLDDHRCLWAERARALESDHRQQHKHEAEDREWDHQLRPVTE